MRYEEHIAAEAHLRALEMAQEMAEEKAKKTKLQNTVANLKSIIKNAKVSAEQAMDLLDIPQIERSEYKTLLES